MDYFREHVNTFSSSVEAVIFMMTVWWGPVPCRLLPKLLELSDGDIIHDSTILKTFVYNHKFYFNYDYISITDGMQFYKLKLS
jgi:hypothetical protein